MSWSYVEDGSNESVWERKVPWLCEVGARLGTSLQATE